MVVSENVLWSRNVLGSDLKFHPHIYSGYYMYIRRFLESHTNVVVVPPPIIAVRYHSQRNVNLGGRGVSGALLNQIHIWSGYKPLPHLARAWPHQ